LCWVNDNKEVNVTTLKTMCIFFATIIQYWM
jgi:hypothetical protein